MKTGNCKIFASLLPRRKGGQEQLEFDQIGQQVHVRLTTAGLGITACAWPDHSIWLGSRLGNNDT